MDPYTAYILGQKVGELVFYTLLALPFLLLVSGAVTVVTLWVLHRGQR